MKLLDGTTNLGSDAKSSTSKAQPKSSYKSKPLQDSDINRPGPGKAPEGATGGPTRAPLGRFDSSAGSRPDNREQLKEEAKNRIKARIPGMPGVSVPAGEDGKPNLKEVANDVQNTLQNAKGDPRKAAAELADKYLQLGEKLGFLLWLIWLIVAVVTTIVGLVIGGIPAIIIFNLLLISPKLVYKITELILDFVGVGEALQTADELGIGNIKITIKTWHKAVIIIFDFIVLAVIAAFIYINLIAVCYALGGKLGAIGAWAADVYNGTSTYSQVHNFCSSVLDSAGLK